MDGASQELAWALNTKSWFYVSALLNLIQVLGGRVHMAEGQPVVHFDIER